jgi:nitrite reductase/ring-hydroxylating ferredoxin subunit
VDRIFDDEPVVGPDLTHAQVLERLSEQGRERRFDAVFIVDADFHHLENQAWEEILGYVEDDLVRHFLRSGGRGDWWVPGATITGGVQEVAGRIQPFHSFMDGTPELSGAQRDIARVREAMAAMNADYITVFPTQLLDMGWNPHTDLEPHIARAWAKWMTEQVLAEEPRIITLLYLRFGHPEACVALIEEFGDRPGVVGGMVTSVRYDPNYHMIQAANWVTNGLPERFPKLKLLFIEGGLAWVPFLMQRLDHEYLMRTGRVRFDHDGRDLVAFRVGERFVAFENVCPHLGGPVCQGKLARRVIAEIADYGDVRERLSDTEISLVCPWHGFEFDLPSGVAVADERYRLRRFELQRDGERFPPVADPSQLTATEVALFCSQLLRAADIAPFELAMWETWSV